MAGFLIRGALVQYSKSVLGPLPNIVVFQFNPEQISRTFEIADRHEEGAGAARPRARQRERAQTSGPPTERFSITAEFSAIEDIATGGAGAAIPRIFGVGPALAALEKMVYPTTGFLAKAIGAVVDAVGSALGAAGGPAQAPGRKVPREELPRILFIWGPSRVLPVEIHTMSISETQYDAFLNPTVASVQIGMSVATIPQNSDDVVGKGALAWTGGVKEVQAAANLVNAVKLALDIIPF